MTIACPGPDPELGVAIRLSTYIDCQARALGENGFQALVGGPVEAGLLSGLVTIFVALIGYRLLLGATPSVRDGVGWAVRLGIVLALVTGWPAFQTLVYRVAADGPGELAAVLLPASGLPSDGLDARVQAAYDTMRLGSTPPPSQGQDAGAQAGVAQPSQGQAAPNGQSGQGRPLGPSFIALPQTASFFVISTAGVIAAFRIAIGFLLAVAPLAILGLLFDATLGLFSGWVRALGGAALSLLAATVVTAIDLVAVEGELGHLQAYAQGGIADVVDNQGLTTIVLLFAIVMPVVVIMAARMASAFRLPLPGSTSQSYARMPQPTSLPLAMATEARQGAGRGVAGELGQPRVAAVADALAANVRREQALVGAGGGEGAPQAPSRRVSIVERASRAEPGGTVTPLGVTGRRVAPRRTLSAARRDRTA